MKFAKKVLIFIFLLGLVIVVPKVNADQLSDIQQKIQEYSQKLAQLGEQKATLQNQIAQFDAQIYLTTLKIQETEEKIKLLGGRIDQLEVSLTALSNAFSQRAVETYKMARVGDPVILLISAPNLGEAVSRFHYLEKIQEADRDLLQKLQVAQNNYKVEKTDQEKLQDTLTEQKLALNNQKAAKAYLLQVTRNDEARYQQLLAQARAEYEAIQGILAGQGTETQIGHVDAGNKIASIIPGPSCNSSGEHLHFMVAQNGMTFNPFNYLKPGIDYQNCSGGGECSAADPFNPSGSWDWPMSPKIFFYQGYGVTWAVQNTWVRNIYSFHNGIDIKSDSSLDVRAVKAGTLYRGAYGVGCSLRYMRVHQDDGGLDTYYLHVDYVM